jgi:hypothetical protein
MQNISTLASRHHGQWPQSFVVTVKSFADFAVRQLFCQRKIRLRKTFRSKKGSEIVGRLSFCFVFAQGRDVCQNSGLHQLLRSESENEQRPRPCIHLPSKRSIITCGIFG